MCFREELDQQPVGALPLRDAIVAYPYTVIRAAIAVMRDRSLGCAVIVDRAHHPIGIFTEKSVLKLLIENASLDERPVCHFGDSSVYSVKSTEPIKRVWEAIQQNHARYVCVTDEEGKLIGLTGQRGIAEYFADCFAQQTTTQRLGSAPWMKQREGA